MAFFSSRGDREAFIFRKSRLLCALAVVAALLPVLAVPGAPALAAPAARAKSTPELLEEAVAEGRIDRATADLHLARAFAGRARSREIPPAFQSTVPWRGTLPLLKLRQRLAAMPQGPARARIAETLEVAAAGECDGSSGSLPGTVASARFYVEHGPVGGGLGIADYQSALEQAWATEVTSFGWPAPPLKTTGGAPGNLYPVRVDDLGVGLYGYVSTAGTYAGFVGNNPNTAWNDVDASASCMVLNSDYSPFPGTALQAMQATVAHEFSHSIQFGIGATSGANAPDESFVEGIAGWMEDEVFDTADDSYHYLWPDFADSLGDYDDSPYPFWFFLRGLSERFGTGVAGGGEQILQDFFELTSKGTGNNLSALAAGVAAKGVSLADAFHQSSIASAFVRPCGGGYSYPYCFQEAAGYLAAAGLPPASGSIASVGAGFSGSLEDEYSARWVTLPAGTYSLTLANTSAGGQLRASAVCDTGSGLVVSAFPSVVGSGASTTLAAFDGSGCVRRLAVLTNQRQSAGNPSAAPVRSFTLGTQAIPASPPGNVAAVPGNASAKVSWTAPASGPPAVGYQVVASPGGQTAAATPQATQATVSGLTNGVAYTFTVQAVNSGSPASNPVSAPSAPVVPRFPPGSDFDGDRDTDVTVYRPSTGQWFVRNQFTASWGLEGDLPVSGDYDNDGSAEPAVFRPAFGAWYVQGEAPVFFGLPGDLPVPGDYDGDGGTDIAIFRPSTGQWFVRDQLTVSWGLPSDIPVPGDYDRDGDTDLAVFRPSTGQWFVRDQVTASWGLDGDIPVPADYDGDGDTDLAVFRPRFGGWYVQGRPAGFFGLPGDVPVPADFDGDGDADVAVFRPSTGQWFVKDQFNVSWGLSDDIPVVASPAVYSKLF